MPQQSVNFDRASGYYDATRGFPPGVEDHIGAFIANTAGLTPETRLLEIGIGTGRIALPLEPYVHSITGADISRNMMLELRRKQALELIHLAQADVEQLPFKPTAFNAVLAVHIFHLVSDPQRVLTDVARVLKPGGRLIYCRNHWQDIGKMQPLVDAWNANIPETIATQDWRSADQMLPNLGWREIGEMQAYAFNVTSTPAEFLERFEQRQYSSTWFWSDDDLKPGIDAIYAAIDQHFGGDKTVPVEQTATFRVQVFEPPA